MCLQYKEIVKHKKYNYNVNDVFIKNTICTLFICEKSQYKMLTILSVMLDYASVMLNYKETIPFALLHQYQLFFCSNEVIFHYYDFVT